MLSNGLCLVSEVLCSNLEAKSAKLRPLPYRNNFYGRINTMSIYWLSHPFFQFQLCPMSSQMHTAGLFLSCLFWLISVLIYLCTNSKLPYHWFMWSLNVFWRSSCNRPDTLLRDRKQVASIFLSWDIFCCKIYSILFCYDRGMLYFKGALYIFLLNILFLICYYILAILLF